MDADTNIWETKGFKDTLKTLWWATQFGFRVSPPLYTFLFIQRLLSVGLPIAHAYFASLVVGELVRLLTVSVDQISQDLVVWLVLATVSLAAKGMNEHLWTYLCERYSQVYTLKAIGAYLERMVSLDAQYYEDASFKTLQDRAYNVLSWQIEATSNWIQDIVANLLGLGLIAGIFLRINSFFIPFIVGPVVLSFCINNKYGKEVFHLWEYGGEDAKHMNHAVWAFNNKSVVHEAKIYGFGRYIVDIFVSHAQRFIDKSVKQANRRYSLLGLAKLAEAVVFGAIQAWLIIRTVAGSITVQGYTLYLQNIALISQYFDTLQRGLARLFEFSRYVNVLRVFFSLSSRLDAPDDLALVEIERRSPKIEFQNVSFRYPNAQPLVLKNVSFTINPGEHVALVGRNGAGKSTLIKLLVRFYDVTSGRILVNSTDIREIDLASYYALWGILFQQFARYWFTVRENVGLSDVARIQDVEGVRRAGEKAGVDVIVDPLPDGYETMLSTDFDNGTDLSEGQWQKVGIARGLFADPCLVVLDEPTSALDAIAETEVFERIENAARDSTTIIVSHRFSTVRKADRILVLDEGEIIESGTHEELMANRRLYNRMYVAQAKGYGEHHATN